MQTPNIAAAVRPIVSAIVAFVLATTSVNAADDLEQLEARIQHLEGTIAKLQQQLAAIEQDTTQTTAQVREEHEEMRQVDTAVLASAAEWQTATSAFHLAGYGDARYADRDGDGGAFDRVTFNPIFHFLYRDKILWESELEFEIEEEGETEVGLEYSAINWFINDYAAVVAGKFLSPLGQFRQNLHPAWINKVASAPPGFGHDGAAPEADIGLQLRGGVPVGERSHVTYALYIANGPELEGEEGEVHGILTEGFTRDADDPVFGGRVSFLPLPNLEIGLSAAIGEATVKVNEEEEVDDDPARDYEAFGVDFAYRHDGFEARGEYIEQDVDDDPNSVAEEGGQWDAWYLQGAYQFRNFPWELVARYTDFTSPHASQEQEQWALGVNYLISPNAIIKFAYEANDGLEGSENDADRWLAQFAYGY